MRIENTNMATSEMYQKQKYCFRCKKSDVRTLWAVGMVILEHQQSYCCAEKGRFVLLQRQTGAQRMNPQGNFSERQQWDMYQPIC